MVVRKQTVSEQVKPIGCSGNGFACRASNLAHDGNDDDHDHHKLSSSRTRIGTVGSFSFFLSLSLYPREPLYL